MSLTRRPSPQASAGRMTQAVAIAYAAGDSAPRVVASGRGLVAEKIIALAKAHSVVVHDSPELVDLLMDVDLDTAIPPELYRAVAEVLAWLYLQRKEQ